jgi:hypothetical protein
MYPHNGLSHEDKTNVYGVQFSSLRLKPKTKITWSSNPTCFFNVYSFLLHTWHIYIFLQCKTLHYETRWASIIMHKPYSHIICLTSNPPWKTIKYIICDLHGGWYNVGH